MKIFIIIFFASFAFCNNPETRYNSEITYEYRAYVDGLKIKLGQASLSIKKPGNIDGVNVYHLNFNVKTSRIGDTIYKIRNNIDVWLNQKNFNVVKQNKIIKEARKNKISNTIIKGNIGNTNGKEYIVKNNVFDPYSLILILSKFNIPQNTSMEFNIIDAGKSRTIEIKNLGFKTVRTPYGRHKGYTLSPISNGKALLKNKGDLEVTYASIKGVLVPVKILIKLGGGVLQLKLKKIRG